MTIVRAPALWLAIGFPLLITAQARGAADIGVDEFLNRAGISFAKGNREEAIELATKAIEAEPKNAKAYYVRGRFYAEVRQSQKALKDLNQSLALDPATPLAYYQRAAENFKLGHIRGCLKNGLWCRIVIRVE
jgi:tetratricopeptide (TPR) repeat protein